MYFEGITGFGAYSRILCLRIYRTNCCSGQVVNVAGLAEELEWEDLAGSLVGLCDLRSAREGRGILGSLAGEISWI
ncbi:hypothetical protein KC331_g36 [Hortaea werneckii]|nr:hypothetical protein KC331_g36 [Hortaea werneckii]